MAARRIAQSAINWTALAERVPESQRPFFIALKAKSDNYLSEYWQIQKPPKIDFAAYKSKIAIPGLVESFQKQYDAVKVPYPADKLTPEVNAQEKKLNKRSRHLSPSRKLESRSSRRTLLNGMMFFRLRK
ncbi:ATP synthase subunit d, mitochondrial [Orchesella cincta]|uniref:ATP synthase subunit d, mitochondrial n=1 Tax=Orchesella cincta TaxID=48709 RepID=A0A1D2N902_ORCCI|nr:ATP synthase subunit d, mitochondrial [Orchesella cincta]